MGRHHTAVPDPVWDETVPEDKEPPPWYAEVAQRLGMDPTARDPEGYSLADCYALGAELAAAEQAALDEVRLPVPVVEAEQVENETAPKPKPRPRKTATNRKQVTAVKGGAS